MCLCECSGGGSSGVPPVPRRVPCGGSSPGLKPGAILLRPFRGELDRAAPSGASLVRAAPSGASWFVPPPPGRG